MKKILAGISLLFFTFSCFAQATKSVQLSGGDYIIMWTCGGMAWSRHNAVHVLTSRQFALDTIHPRCYAPHDISDLTLTTMPAALYDKARKILDSVPLELLNTSKNAWGKSLVDGVTTSVLAKIGGREYSWTFRSGQEGCSAEIRAFLSSLRSNF